MRYVWPALFVALGMGTALAQSLPGLPGVQFTWLDGSRWRAEVVLPDSTNHLQFQAFNRQGDKVGEDSLTVVTTGAPAGTVAALVNITTTGASTDRKSVV